MNDSERISAGQSQHARLEETKEAADIALGSAEIAQKAAAKVLDSVPVPDSLPTPDPRDDVNFQRLAGLEQSTLARLSRVAARWALRGGRLRDVLNCGQT